MQRRLIRSAGSLLLVLVFSVTWGVSVELKLAAQASSGQPASTSGAGQSAAEDGPEDEKPLGRRDGQPDPLPVSLDRIRAGLSRPLTQPLFGRLEDQPHFTLAIEERQKFEELVSRLKIDPAPVFVPPGGIYAQEIQRLAFNPTSRPWMQPYAAFTPAQTLTIAIENLIGKYLGGPLLKALTSAQRAQAEAEAKEEVTRAIHEYCASQPNSGSGLLACHGLPHTR